MTRAIIGAGGGGGKGGGGSSNVPQESPDSLRSKAFAKVLDLVSEGEVEGLVNGAKSIYLDGTPLQNSDNSYNFTGLEIQTRTGTQAQSYVPGFSGVENTVQVGTEVTVAASVTRQITNANADAIRVTIGIPQLTFQNPETGDLKGTSVTYAIDLQSNGGGFNQVLTDTVTGKTTSRYQRSYRVDLTGSGPWDVRVRRVTADSGQVNLVNKTWWDAYTEIIDAKLRYPNSALVGIKIDSAQFQNIPTRGYDMKLLRVKVPSNYNPTTRAYTGSWDGTFQVAWTDNPAWCFYDLVINDRYGLGSMVSESQVDKWALYQIGRYCDELVPDGFGGTEPRFTCNFYLQTRAEAYKVLQDFASIFRGMVFWATGSVTASQDAPSDAVALFTAANVVEGKFAYSGSALRARHTVALVTWNDPDDLYRQKVEYVEDTDGITRYGVNQTEIIAVGCTSRGQANRVGRWLLYSERYETETIQFSVGLEGAMVRPGNVIKVSDANRASARLGGRVALSTLSSVTVDRAPSTNIVGWTIYVTLQDGTVEQRPVSSYTGNVINVGTAFSSPPPPDSVWILASVTVEPQTFRVVAVTENTEDASYTISALKHEPSKYDAVEQGLVLETRDYTLLNDIPPAPTGLAASESLYTYQAEVRARITLSWEASFSASKYFIDWRQDDGNFVRVETSATSYDLLDITPGVFTFRVYAANPAGLISLYAETSITALGKTAPPSNVTGFTSQIDPNIGATLFWNRVSDLDIDSYEIRVGAVWETATLVGQVKGTTMKIGFLPTGSVTYSIKALDTSGIYSSASASTTVTISAPGTPTVSVSQAGDAFVLAWTVMPGSLAIANFDIRYGASFGAGVPVTSVNGSTYTVPISWTGSRTFWVAAVDVAGTVGAAGSVATNVTLAAAPTITAAFAGENVVLSWGAVQGTVSTVEYDVRYGASYAAGISLGKIKGTSFQTRANWTGARTFWVAAIDANDNTGTAGSVVATVSAAAAPTVTSAFAGENVVLSWTAVQGTMPTDFYDIRHGATWAGGTPVATIKATTASLKAQWAGARTFWVAAVDINGTAGASSSTTATVAVPVSVSMTQEVIDNNVLLRWGDATATLPVDYYELRRGASWATATVIGRVSARFSAIFESVAGTFTYRVRGYDVAGNEGAESTVAALVSQPPDYALQYDYNSAFPGTRTNIATDVTGELLAPVSTTETWQAHFTSRSWNTPQDQINAGYPIYVQPSQGSGSYEETVDYGTVLAATKITSTLSYTTVSGVVTVTPTISVKKLVGDPWTDYAGQASAFVTDFQFAKIRYDFSSTGGDDLITITGLNIRFDVKLRNDAGSVNAVSTDSGGTTVNFNIPFVDVQSITLTPKGTAARIAVYDFTDVPNPTSFKVLLFDTSGSRVSGEVGWSVKGI